MRGVLCVLSCALLPTALLVRFSGFSSLFMWLCAGHSTFLGVDARGVPLPVHRPDVRLRRQPEHMMVVLIGARERRHTTDRRRTDRRIRRDFYRHAAAVLAPHRDEVNLGPLLRQHGRLPAGEPRRIALHPRAQELLRRRHLDDRARVRHEGAEIAHADRPAVLRRGRRDENKQEALLSCMFCADTASALSLLHSCWHPRDQDMLARVKQ